MQSEATGLTRVKGFDFTIVAFSGEMCELLVPGR